MKSFVKAINIVFGLLIYKYKKPNNIQIINEKYPNIINNDQIPLKSFIPNKASKTSIVIFPGASPYAEEHPGMIMLGSILAKAGFSTYVPRIPLLKELKINNQIVESFQHFYLWLLNEKKLNNNNLILVGMSFGGAILLKASIQRPMTLYAPKSILTYGTYFDFESSLDFLINGNIMINNKNKTINPHPWGLIIIFYNYLPRINIDYDVESMIKILYLRIQELEDEITVQLNKLPAKEKIILTDILEGNRNKEIDRIINLFLDELRDEFILLSPRYWSNKINNKVFIFHGANDSMVPYTESIALSKNIIDSELFISYLYEHRKISSNKGMFFKIKEFWGMIIFFSRFINYNES